MLTLILVDITITLPSGRYFGDVYDIYTVLIKRNKSLRRKSGVDETRIRRDERRNLIDKDYDYVIENNGKKAELFNNIERIYEEIKNK